LRFACMPPEVVQAELRKANIDPTDAIRRVKELVYRRLAEWHRRAVHQVEIYLANCRKRAARLLSDRVRTCLFPERKAA
jgi:hypothetical protein